MGPVRQFIGAEPVAEVTLNVWDGGPGKLEWYEDDGLSMEDTSVRVGTSEPLPGKRGETDAS